MDGGGGGKIVGLCTVASLGCLRSRNVFHELCAFIIYDEYQ